MKVGTDAMLLGALTNPEDTVKRILDVGTGCGVIALMLAQKTRANIDAIDIDPLSVEEASLNFRNSPWAYRLKAIHISFTELSLKAGQSYDCIVSNPPFFSKSCSPKDPRKEIARHQIRLDQESFLVAADRLLTPEGTLHVILPCETQERFVTAAGIHNIFPYLITYIIPREGKSANRCVIHLKKGNTTSPVINHLILRDSSGRYSADYKRLTADFHAEDFWLKC